MKFIKLHRRINVTGSPEEIYVNSENIQMLQRDEPVKVTDITFENDEYMVMVEETPEEILNLIEEAEKRG